MLTVLHERGVPHLVAASLVGRLPAAMAGLALVRLIVDQAGSYAFAPLVTAAYILVGTPGHQGSEALAPSPSAAPPGRSWPEARCRPSPDRGSRSRSWRAAPARCSEPLRSARGL